MEKEEKRYKVYKKQEVTEMLKQMNPNLWEVLSHMERMAMLKQGVISEHIQGAGIATNYKSIYHVIDAIQRGELYLTAEGQRLLTANVNDIISLKIFQAYTNKPSGYSVMNVEGKMYRINTANIRKHLMYNQEENYWEMYIEKGFDYTTQMLVHNKVQEYKAKSQEIIPEIGEAVKVVYEGVLSQKDYEAFIEESKRKVHQQIVERIPNFEHTRSTQARINHYFKRHAVKNYVQQTIMEENPTTAKEIMQAKEKVQQSLIDNLIAEIGRDNDYTVNPSTASADPDSFDFVYRGINYTQVLKALYKGCVIVKVVHETGEVMMVVGTLDGQLIKKKSDEVAKDLERLQDPQNREKLFERIQKYKRLLVYTMAGGKPHNIPFDQIQQVVIEGKAYDAKDDTPKGNTGAMLRNMLVYDKEGQDYKRYQRFEQEMSNLTSQKSKSVMVGVSNIYGKGYSLQVEYLTKKGEKAYYYISPKGVFQGVTIDGLLRKNDQDIKIIYEIDPNEGKEQQIKAIYKYLTEGKKKGEEKQIAEMLAIYNYSFDLRQKKYKAKV